MADPAFLTFAQAESSRPLIPFHENGVTSFLIDHNNLEQVLLDSHAASVGLPSPANTARERAASHASRVRAARARETRHTMASYMNYLGWTHRNPSRSPSPLRDDVLIDSSVYVHPDGPLDIEFGREPRISWSGASSIGGSRSSGRRSMSMGSVDISSMSGRSWSSSADERSLPVNNQDKNKKRPRKSRTVAAADRLVRGVTRDRPRKKQRSRT